MKTTIICLLALGGVGSLSSCVSVTKREPASTSTTTTTEQTTTSSHPFSPTVETQTTRNY